MKGRSIQEEEVKMLEAELEILRLAKHENIVSVVAACFKPRDIAMLIVKLVHGGSLHEMLYTQHRG